MEHEAIIYTIATDVVIHFEFSCLLADVEERSIVEYMILNASHPISDKESCCIETWNDFSFRWKQEWSPVSALKEVWHQKFEENIQWFYNEHRQDIGAAIAKELTDGGHHDFTVVVHPDYLAIKVSAV